MLRLAVTTPPLFSSLIFIGVICRQWCLLVWALIYRSSVIGAGWPLPIFIVAVALVRHGGVYLIFPVTVQVLILQGTTQDAADNLFNPLGWGNMRYTCAYYSTIFLLLQSSGVVDVNFNRAKKFVQHFSVNDTTQNNQATNGSLNPASWCRSGVHSD